MTLPFGCWPRSRWIVFLTLRGEGMTLRAFRNWLFPLVLAGFLIAGAKTIRDNPHPCYRRIPAAASWCGGDNSLKESLYGNHPRYLWRIVSVLCRFCCEWSYFIWLLLPATNLVHGIAGLPVDWRCSLHLRVRLVADVGPDCCDAGFLVKPLALPSCYWSIRCHLGSSNLPGLSLDTSLVLFDAIRRFAVS